MHAIWSYYSRVTISSIFFPLIIFRLNGTPAFVDNVGVNEDVNFVSGQFRYKRETLEQATEQSKSIDILQKQQKSSDKYLNIEASFFEQVFKDNRETKIRLIRALIHFDYF